MSEILFHFEHSGYAANIETTKNGFIARDEAGGYELHATSEAALAEVAEFMANAADIASENGDADLATAILAGRPE